MHHQAEPLAKEFSNGLATWLAALIAVSLAPIPSSLIHGLTTTLIAAGISLGVIWLARHAQPGDLERPSWARTVAFTLLAIVSTVLLVVGCQAGVWGDDGKAALPFVVGVGASVTVLMPLQGRWTLTVPVAATVGGATALAAGVAIGATNAVMLGLQLIAPGVLIGVAAAVLMHRARELTGHTRTAAMDKKPR